MQRFIYYCLSVTILTIIIVYAIGCQTSQKGYEMLSNFPYKRLSEYQIFTGNMKNMEADESFVFYTLNTPLFSDYAEKSRWVYIPNGTSMIYQAEREFDMPDGSIIVKTFYYPNDMRDENSPNQIIETRLLIKRAGEWEAYPYVWNDEQTDATLEIAGGDKNIEWVDKSGTLQTLKYSIPNKNQCTACHNYDNQITPIGIRARHLNKEEGGVNQLVKWQNLGYLKGLPTDKEIRKNADWTDMTLSIDDRARAYLDINCSHCHNPKGPAKTTGLYLETAELSDVHIGICKLAVAAGRGSGNRTYGIHPGNPENSILLYRLDSEEPDVMMPELGRKMIHKEGVALISEWITAMKGDCN